MDTNHEGTDKTSAFYDSLSTIYLMPVEITGVQKAILEGFHLLKGYAREHVLFCLIPAFFIAGAISIFISQTAVLKYLGENSKKIISYTVASVSGGILAVCSCTVLPLFAGIYKRGAGTGPLVEIPSPPTCLPQSSEHSCTLQH